MNNKDIDLLCCPNCRSNIEKANLINGNKSNLFKCRKCKILFPEIDKIPILLPNSARCYELEFPFFSKINDQITEQTEIKLFLTNTIDLLLTAKDTPKSWEWEDEVYWGKHYQKKLGKSETADDWGVVIWMLDWTKKNMPLSVKKNNSVYLDVGAGEGHPFRYVISKFFPSCSKYIATDISISALKYNRSLNKHKNSMYVLASANALPFKNNKIDTITYFGILHHAERQADTIPENADFLKKGGSMIIQEALKRPQISKHLGRFNYFKNKEESAHEHTIDPDNIRKNLYARKDMQLVAFKEDYSPVFGVLRHVLKIKIFNKKIIYKFIDILDRLTILLLGRISFFKPAGLYAILYKSDQ